MLRIAGMVLSGHIKEQRLNHVTFSIVHYEASLLIFNF